MLTKMQDLNPVYQLISVSVLMVNDSPVLLDSQKTSLNFDVVLLFSSPIKAATYAAQYASIKDAQIRQTTISELVRHFEGRVEYFMLDRPPC